MTKFLHQPFPFAQKIRHALVESSVKIVGEAAWRSCRQLQIVTCQTQSSAHCMALAGAKLRGWLPPVASISALKYSRSVDPQRGWARLNALDKCEQHDQPKWLRFLPADANDWWREDFLEPAPKASNAFAAGMVHKHSARKLRQVKCANIEWSRQLASTFTIQ